MDIPLLFTNISVYQLNIQYRFILTVIGVTEDHDDSQFSCHIESESMIQWQHTAQLSVNKDTDIRNGVALVAGSVFVVACLVSVGAVVVAVSGLLVVKRRRRKRNRRLGSRADEGVWYTCIEVSRSVLLQRAWAIQDLQFALFDSLQFL